jgi:hypothetical protein
MAKKPKEGIKLLRIENKIIKYKDANGNLVEQEVKVKIYESKKATKDDSLATEILDSNQPKMHEDHNE